MAERFDKKVRTVNERINNLLAGGELDESSVIRNFRISANLPDLALRRPSSLAVSPVTSTLIRSPSAGLVACILTTHSPHFCFHISNSVYCMG